MTGCRVLLRVVLVASLLLGLLLLPTAGAAAGGSEHGYNPTDPRNFSWVEEGVLAVGGGGLTEADVLALHALGFTAIATFRAEHRDPVELMDRLGVAHYDGGIQHGIELEVGDLRAFLAWAQEQEAAGRKMYIHCTNGWHRAHAFGAAWDMQRHGLTFEEAKDRAVERRPGTVMRAPGALLDLEAELTARPGLSVSLQSPLERPERGGTMPVTVEVLAEGRPAANAQVRIWSEESALRITGATDAEGRFTFPYRAPARSFMDHLYAYASLDGYVDGADGIEMFFEEPVRPARQLELQVTQEADALTVRVTDDGAPVRARLFATGPGGWTADAWTRGGETRIAIPLEGGAVTLRAERWGSLGATETLTLAPAALDDASPASDGSTDEAASSATPARQEGLQVARVPTAPVLAVAALAVGALAVGGAARSARRRGGR